MEFNKITFLNQTQKDITSVKIISLKTNKKLGCSFIPKGQFCSYSFHEKLVNNNKIEISWEKNGEVFLHSKEIKNIDKSSYPLNIHIEILENNQLIINPTFLPLI